MDPLYEVHEKIFSKLNLEDKRKYALLNKSSNELFRRNTINMHTIAQNTYNNLNRTEEYITPYSIRIGLNEYYYIALYLEVNGISLAIKLRECFIYVYYIPPEDIDFIKRNIRFGYNMKDFDSYYLINFINIRFDKPYYKLGTFYMCQIRKQFFFSVKQNGYKELTELDIFSILYTLWKKYYHKRLPIYRFLINDYNYYNKSIMSQDTMVALFEAPYDVNKINYITFPEFIKKNLSLYNKCPTFNPKKK